MFRNLLQLISIIDFKIERNVLRTIYLFFVFSILKSNIIIELKVRLKLGK